MLVRATAEALNIDAAFVEKDFWVTEVLRAVAVGVPITVGSEQAHVQAVFKGGTSLSRVFGLIERFSEDVDLLVVFPAGASEKARDKALKALAANARTHLCFAEDACRPGGASTRGVKRAVRFVYPREFSSPAAEDGVLLEMGSRGGTQPHARHQLRSLIAEYAERELGEPADTWEEWAPVTVDVLAPERTLLEKMAALHDLATRAVGEDDALKLSRAARHYYDIHQLLQHEPVRAALTELGPDGVAALATDVDAHSKAAGWPFTPRPVDGYGTSPAFATAGPHVAEVTEAYRRAMGMVYGAKPALTDCLDTVRQHAILL